MHFKAKMLSLWILSLWVGIFCSCSSANAASCCSGGSSLPNLILNDDYYTFRLSAQNAFVVGDSLPNGKALWKDDSFNEQELTLTPSLALKTSENWQVGARFPIKNRAYADESSWAPGDFSISAAWEPFPLYTYSYWRPRILMAASLLIPTGISTYETTQALLESSGSGFFTPGLSLIAAKTFEVWDFLLAVDLKKQFPRAFAYEDVEPGWIFSSQISAGYSIRSLRLGFSLAPSYEQSRKLKRAQTQGPSKLVWNTQFDVSYLLNPYWSTQLGYSDQTLMGPSFNVALERSLSLGIIYHGL